MKYDPRELIGKVIDLKSLADYQEGSVVSRMVVNKKAGTVTAFAFEAGEGFSEHSAPFDALVIKIFLSIQYSVPDFCKRNGWIEPSVSSLLRGV